MSKFTVGSVWRTRDGRKAVVIINDLKHTFPLVARVTSKDKTFEYMQYYTKNGEYYNTRDTYTLGISERDLVAPWRDPVTVSGWVNVYAHGFASDIYISKELADGRASSHRIACVHVTGTEELADET